MKTFYYDEWDFRAADYKPRWCAVRERLIDEGDGRLLREDPARARPAWSTRRSASSSCCGRRPSASSRSLEDGEDVDLDAAIEFIVYEARGRRPTAPKIYWRRNKIERDVAVAFLLDMSASTDEEIEKRRPRTSVADDFDDDPRKLLQQWLAQSRAQQADLAAEAHHRPREGDRWCC